ncbi:helix-turn-helix domain-containing protein [Verminephrobacter eiseniae]|uniref:helix-turn-helix domain-containing protein n=1 Tax=Verminephrobacter eiseniae TaxID=364317 RepID=UPI002238493B|nr:helix-turn-helix transcriptional regulator [Verminephrobacter eiseniae]MCW5234871.1 XRE family transcriptional regulator [Verminephrobacter eiseniae]
MMKQRVMDGAGPREKSGHVVADPGLQGVDRFQIKSGLVHAIAWTMQHRSLTQQAMAEISGIARPRLSLALRGDFSQLSERKLMDAVTRLGFDIEIKVKRTRKAQGVRQLVLS